MFLSPLCNECYILGRHHIHIVRLVGIFSVEPAGESKVVLSKGIFGQFD